MVAICAGTALRLIPATIALLGGTIVIGAGIAVANVLLPGVIKRDFGSRIGLMTGIYSMSLSIGAALAAGITVPLARVAHTDWRTTLALWGLLAVLAVIVWVPQVRRRAHRAASTAPPPAPRRRRCAGCGAIRWLGRSLPSWACSLLGTTRQGRSCQPS
jgi:CP family cyanate transporter-like MFS transporter